MAGWRNTSTESGLKITRKGYYTIQGPDGLLLKKPDGSTRNVTSRDECYERITEDGRGGTFTIQCPDREVEVGLIIAAPQSAQAWDYPGIPYVTDNVPSAIMPTLPTGADKAGWPYDPCTYETPTFADGADQYYVDSVNGNDGTAGNSGRGSVALPRASLPGLSGDTWTLSAGSQVFVVGDGATYTVADQGFTSSGVTWSGTENSPVWLIGVGTTRPVFTVDRFWTSDCQYCFIHFCDFYPGVGERLRMRFGGAGTSTIGENYWCIRHCRMYGDGNDTQTNPASVSWVGQHSSDPSEFFILYDCEIFDMGQWDFPSDTSLDIGGFSPQHGTRYCWVIDCKIYHCRGDSIILEGSTWSATPDTQAYRTHYTYIAGCEMYENYENAFDGKNGYHTIISSCLIHDFYNSVKTANSTAVILSNNDEGQYTGWHWIMFCKIYNTGANENAASTVGVRDSGKSGDSDEANFIIGNEISGCQTAINLGNAQATRRTIVVNNTCYDCDTAGFNNSQSATGHIVRLHGNIFSSCTEIDLGSAFTATLTDNVIYNTTNNGSWDTNTGNVTTDPSLVDPTNRDFSLNTGSSAIDIATEDAVYDEFSGMYGVSIEEDIVGTTRPQGVAWDAGANEKI